MWIETLFFNFIMYYAICGVIFFWVTMLTATALCRSVARGQYDRHLWGMSEENARELATVIWNPGKLLAAFIMSMLTWWVFFLR